MLGKIMELGSMLRQVQNFGGQIREINDKLKNVRIEGSSAGGLVVVVVNGLQEMVSCKIDPAVFKQGDAELLEELFMGAVNGAIDESRLKQTESMTTIADEITKNIKG